MLNLQASGKAAKKAGKAPKSRSRDAKRGRSAGRNLRHFTFKVLKQVHPDTEFPAKLASIMNSFVNDIFERIAAESPAWLTTTRGKCITSREIQTAVRLCFFPVNSQSTQFPKEPRP
ncbi:histone H2B [Trichonephila inaurata madagascariensis]|uniref:Histone H2B n=1 Tax=Trichonephila inaurata madagascariensis TaxID=2747483 RepID=A0A8X6XID3_9ARAC|nr:histone H2B [Trichonephila inaurata madagascariensis]